MSTTPKSALDAPDHDGPADPPAKDGALAGGERAIGLDWTLSAETRAALDEIDASLRRGRLDGPTALFD